VILIIAFLCDLSYIGITCYIIRNAAARKNNTAANSKDFISTVSSAGLTAATQASSDLMKGEKTADGAAAVEPIRNPETASGLSLGVTSENNKSTDVVQVTTLKSVELSQDKVVRVISYCSCEAG
jgi:hypothetical protein